MFARLIFGRFIRPLVVVATLIVSPAAAENLAYDQPAETVHPQLTEHSQKMAKQILQPLPNVYLALGYGLANVTMVEGDDGIIIIDTLDSEEAAAEVMAEFRKITDKPVKAVIYTHNHYDHIVGVKAFVSQEDVDEGRANVYAHETLMDGVANFASVVNRIIGVRSTYTFGNLLERGPEGSINEGIGPLLSEGTATFIAPNVTFEDRLEVTVAGVRMVLQYAPSETDDEIVIWFPDLKMLHTAEVIQGETFPNLHTIRGTKYRDPVKWFRAFDLMREFEAEVSVPSHGRPTIGAENVDELYRSYRDAIQYVHDQTIRYMNKGYTPDELVEVIHELPPHLKDHPWLGEFYGTVEHSVRQIYTGYLGWFEADPTFLDPLPRAARSERYVAQMGGRDAILAGAQAAFDEGDYRWTAEVLTHLIRVAPEDMDARNLKAAALRQLGFATMNINWRNWYLTSALELEGTIDWTQVADRNTDDLAKALPIGDMINAMTTLLKAEETFDVNMTMAFDITDTGEGYSLEIRNGIMQLHRRYIEDADVILHLEEATLRDVLQRKVNLPLAIAMGDVNLDGGPIAFARFFSYLDRSDPNAPLELTLR